MQSVIVGWQVYELTHDALSLGMIGLSEALPFFCVSLFGGHTADKVDRKKIIILSSLIYLICTAALLVISTGLQPVLVTYGVLPIYAIIFLTGVARGFLSPAQRAFVAQLVPRGLFGNASTWNSLVWQIAEVTGPAAGGLIYGFSGVGSAYATVVVMTAIGLYIFTLVGSKPLPEQKRGRVYLAKSLGGTQICLQRSDNLERDIS